MRWLPGWNNPYNVDRRRMIRGLHSTGSELDRKFWPALALYGLLALLAWFTMGPESVLVKGRPVEMRWIPLLVLGGLALRTLMARHAGKFRGAGEKDS